MHIFFHFIIRFGRGTDFKCTESVVIDNGGVHVIQTFLSQNVSEETQIQGRTCRQGKVGSYSMVLIQDDLEKFGIEEKEHRKDVTEMKMKNKLYSTLKVKRDAQFEIDFPSKNKFLTLIKSDHDEAMKFVQNLFQGKATEFKTFLQERNTATYEELQPFRMLILMDATGSMGGLLQAAKNTVTNMFEQTLDILKGKTTKAGKVDASMELKFMVYRDYDVKESELLESSGWENNPEKLQVFMAGMRPFGGNTYEEAIEVGLQYVNAFCDEECISQVLVIADAPPNSQDLVKESRINNGGEERWLKSTRFNNLFNQRSFYMDEIKKIKIRGIPVHAFYIGDEKNLVSTFEYMAEETGGECGSLSVTTDEGSKHLTEIVANGVFQGKANGDTDALQEWKDEYRRTFLTQGHL